MQSSGVIRWQSTRSLAIWFPTLVSAPLGVEVRAASCLDIALWDLFGKYTGQPIVQLLGGRTRERIRTYNTCAGAQYMRKAETQSTANWGLPAGSSTSGVTGFDDLK
jgi:L-alanine-DL-glutamate epimerase-like enolase superfamily enzyme